MVGWLPQVVVDSRAGTALVLAGIAGYMALELAAAALPRVAGAAVRLALVVAMAAVGAHLAQSVVAQQLDQTLAPLNQVLAGFGSGQLPSQMLDLSWLTDFTGGGMVWR